VGGSRRRGRRHRGHEPVLIVGSRGLPSSSDWRSTGAHPPKLCPDLLTDTSDREHRTLRASSAAPARSCAGPRRGWAGAREARTRNENEREEDLRCVSHKSRR
jgi:hypothetical protein